MTSRILLLCLAVVLAAAAKNSIVHLQSDPALIQTVLTQQMIMICSINQTGVAQSSDSLRFVTSLVISRDGAPLASVTPFSPAAPQRDLGKLNVTGSISTQNGAVGELNLHWSYPDEQQSGNYSCEVNGVNAVGQPVRAMAEIFVPVRNPNLADISTNLANQTRRLQDATAATAKLRSDLDVATAMLTGLQSRETARQQELNAVNASSAALELKMDGIVDLLKQSKQVDQGLVPCGDSSTWTNLGGNLYETNVTANFSLVFAGSPTVQLTPTHLDNYNDNSNLRHSVNFWLDVTDVWEEGFVLRCRIETTSTSYLRLYTLDAAWLAIGRGKDTP